MSYFANITFFDVLDIILVGVLVFEIIRFFRHTSAMGVFAGILIIYAVWIVVQALNMKLLSFILGQILGVGVIALIIIFQPEIRRFLLSISGRIKNSSGRKWLKKIFSGAKSQPVSGEILEELTKACSKMAQTKTGALIVLRHNDQLEDFINTGDQIDASINSRLIENIFFKNTPLHDGAMIISSKRILAARCTLPLTSSEAIPPQYGMRHKAAIGITEISDATVIVVSEETGNISYVSKGTLTEISSIAALRLAIENSYK